MQISIEWMIAKISKMADIAKKTSINVGASVNRESVKET